MGKKKEKIVDLKPEVEKISEEHLVRLQRVVNKINELQFNIGGIEIQKHTMLHELATAQEGVAKMQSLLNDAYGTCNVNVKDGSIDRTENSDG